MTTTPEQGHTARRAYHAAGVGVYALKALGPLRGMTLTIDDAGRSGLSAYLQFDLPKKWEERVQTPGRWQAVDEDKEDKDAPYKDWLRRLCVCAYCGQWAERRYVGADHFYDSTSLSDINEALRAIVGHALSDNARASDFEQREVLPEANVFVAEHWPAIERLAQTLQTRRTIPGPEARQIVNEAEKA